MLPKIQFNPIPGQVLWPRSLPLPITHLNKKLKINLLIKLFIVLNLVFFSFIPIRANTGSGTERFSFLATDNHARPNALLGAYSALDLGLEGVLANPANLATESNGILFSINKNNSDIYRASFIWGLDTMYHFPVAVSLDYIHYGSIDPLDASGNSAGETIHPLAIIPTISLAHAWNSALRAGLSLKLPNQYLGDFYESVWSWGMGLDAGMMYQYSRSIQVGLSLNNFGKEINSPLRIVQQEKIYPQFLKPD